jgi:hypothetical protein
MIERAGGARLGDEPPQLIGIGHGSLVQDLQRDLALEPRIPRAIHFAAASSERFEDFVRAERRPVRSSHLHPTESADFTCDSASTDHVGGSAGRRCDQWLDFGSFCVDGYERRSTDRGKEG